jgi:hypothetical protein
MCRLHRGPCPLSGHGGKHILTVSFSAFDPCADFGAGNFRFFPASFEQAIRPEQITCQSSALELPF